MTVLKRIQHFLTGRTSWARALRTSIRCLQEMHQSTYYGNRLLLKLDPHIETMGARRCHDLGSAVSGEDLSSEDVDIPATQKALPRPR